MKLSEAMMLGSVTCKMVPNDWNSCALGSAANAIGIPVASPKNFPRAFSPQECADGRHRSLHIMEAWPWLSEPNEFFTSIWEKFDLLVCEGKMSLEELVDYVRSIEPECGECNRFDCGCVQKIDAVPDNVPAQV